MVTASYASEVVLRDERNGLEEPHRIYMNHVLDYDGYRFFQSSYDQDELGTVLSANHDVWGTWVTYIGYLIMGIGMFFTLFVQGTRFDRLGTILKKNAAKAVTIFALLISGATMAQEDDHEGHDHEGHDHAAHSHEHESQGDMMVADHSDYAEQALKIDAEHAEKFGALLIQDNRGRIKPVNTLASEVMRKVTRKEKFMGLGSV